jgi:hypothetical protein
MSISFEGNCAEIEDAPFPSPEDDVPQTFMDNFFVGIGAQKAATSWLAQYLDDHPQVGFSPIKELHYFDAEYCADFCGTFHQKMAARLAKTASMAPVTPHRKFMIKLKMLGLRVQMESDPLVYRSYFDSVRKPQHVTVGEITPSYSMMDSRGFAAIKKMMPAAKFILILRDPLTRYMSQLRFEEAQRQDADFQAEDRLLDRLYDTNYMLRTNYVRTIEELEKVVPKDDICVVFFEHLTSAENNGQALEKITRFLSIDYLPGDLGVKINAGKKVEFDRTAHRRIVRRFAQTYEYIFERYGAEVPASWRDSYGLLGGPRSAITRFYDDVVKLKWVRFVQRFNRSTAPHKKV